MLLTNTEICLNLCDAYNGKCQRYPHSSLIERCGKWRDYNAGAKAQLAHTMSRFKRAVRQSLAGKEIDLSDDEFELFSAIQNSGKEG